MDCREVRRRIQHFDISREREPTRRWLPLAEKTHFQLHPLVVPQDSQTKQEPAGRMRTPQVEQKGASTADIPGVNASSLRGEVGATVGASSAPGAPWTLEAPSAPGAPSARGAGKPSPSGPVGWPMADSPSVAAAELASAGAAAPVDAGAGCDAVDGPVPFTSSIRSAVVLMPSACRLSTSR